MEPIWTHFERPGGPKIFHGGGANLGEEGCESAVQTWKINVNLGRLLGLRIIKLGQFVEAQGFKHIGKPTYL